MATDGNKMPPVKSVSKGKEGSAGEERAESPHFEKIEDAHDETTQIKPGTKRHNQLSALWKAPSKDGKVAKMTNTNGVPKPTRT